MTKLPAALAGHASYHGWLGAQDGYRGQITFFNFSPGRPVGTVGEIPERYKGLLGRLGITPYGHQAEVLAAVAAGENVVAATPTASGKSLGYQVPTLETLDRGGRALYLFPTKALAHDQLEKLAALAAAEGHAGAVAAFDGDTPAQGRVGIRESARCVLTNPDMLHYGILPHHTRWAQFLGGLELLVLDELHAYRGVMGTHVANIVRRLLRLARRYGANPQIVAASATIGNPAEHAENLTGEAFRAVTDDRGPSAERELLFWRPPDLPGAAGEAGRRRSTHSEAADLAALFLKTGLKSIFFCNSRKSAELLRRYTADLVNDDERTRLSSYRAGYSPADRRDIEQGFKAGRLTVLTATSALELGVDVGGVDAVVLVGYPGSLTALYQRAGRAGRGGTRALTLLIPGNDPLDEFYLTHPEAITEGRVERAVADAFNTELHPRHLACAAVEQPLTADESLVGGADLGGLEGFVAHGGRWYYRGAYPHRQLSVRGMLGGRVRMRAPDGRALGEADLGSALRELHPGAVYLHQGENYLVRNLDLEKGEAYLLPHLEDTYTQVRSETDVTVLAETERFGRVGVGRVQVTTSVTSYVRKRLYSDVVLDERPLELPELSYPTQALWFGAADVAGAVHPSLLPSALHALEHALIGLLPAFVLCERADVGGVSYPVYPTPGAAVSGQPAVFIYDGYPGGVGYALAGAAGFAQWLAAAHDLLTRCGCKGGCPRCVLSPKCGNGNQLLDKGAAAALAGALRSSLGEPVVLKA